MQISLSPSGKFYYFWNEKKTIFIVNGSGIEKAFSEFGRFYKRELKNSDDGWRLAALPLLIQSESAEIKNEFAKIVFATCNKLESIAGLSKFDYKDQSHQQIILDVILCINENYQEGIIHFNENSNPSLSSISITSLNATWRSEFTKKKSHKKPNKILMTLPLSSVTSFVADSDGVTAKLKDENFVTIGYGDYSSNFEDYLDKCGLEKN